MYWNKSGNFALWPLETRSTGVGFTPELQKPYKHTVKTPLSYRWLSPREHKSWLEYYNLAGEMASKTRLFLGASP